ncbi:hypothetical protein J2S74_004633 [Evansella vedderi]|uniref:Uncharacterized protein n=1 Tax=Evansella vedderi TaxID=38282 RepID=A0ABU0A136_9BACI|nr:hypothetical protein [Evansella vedderi]MDQ0257175.1 hypothetical protein [Evansella vedderi]
MSEAAAIFTKVARSGVFLATARQTEPLPALFILHRANITCMEVYPKNAEFLFDTSVS